MTLVCQEQSRKSGDVIKEPQSQQREFGEDGWMDGWVNKTLETADCFLFLTVSECGFLLTMKTITP